MKAYQYSINPYDNMDFLREQFNKLTEVQKVDLLMELSRQRYCQGRTMDELKRTIEQQEKQYQRALNRINILQKELRELTEPEE